VHSVAATHPKGRAVTSLVRAGVALHVAHTNADVADPGVSDALADVLGLLDVRPLRPEPGQAADKIVTFVPHDSADAVVDALSAAGAGRIGAYDRCAWTVGGEGTFTARAGAHPTVGSVGTTEQVPETRVEMVLPRGLRPAVVDALRAAHPYEEPAFDLVPLAALPGRRGLGRVGRLAAPAPLAGFAATVAAALPTTAAGVRVGGDPDRVVETVAVCGGAGDDMFDDVRRAGADVYVTADLRHHPVLEAREESRGGPPYLVDAGHWATESVWLASVEERLRAALAALGDAGTTVETHISRLRTDPWDFVVGAEAPGGTS
jgi:putative NIF3 family GTP cyclohydrolase 1 type 2